MSRVGQCAVQNSDRTNSSATVKVMRGDGELVKNMMIKSIVRAWLGHGEAHGLRLQIGSHSNCYEHTPRGAPAAASPDTGLIAS